VATFEIGLVFFSHGESPEEALQNLMSDLNRKGLRIDSGVTFKKIFDEDRLVRVSEVSV
tara:strand:- start:262 stop:438 length:177 start_codon:yes stop_codon:yes gene_type:complete